MPRCEYCGAYPYETYCKSFHKHVETCRVLFEARLILGAAQKAKRQEKLKPTPQPVVVNNYFYVQTLVMGDQNVYLDYPKNEFTQKLIKEAETFDLKTIKSVEDLNQIVGGIQDMNDKEIEKCLSGTDKKARSKALSFLADVVRVIRTRLQKEAPKQTLLIEAAEDFEKECLDDKKRLIEAEPTVDDVD